MRRIVLALLGTIVGTTLLIGLKTERFATPLGLTAGAPLDPAAGAGANGAAGPGGNVQPGQSGAPGQTGAPGQAGQPGQPGTTPGAGQTSGQTTTTGATPKPGTSTSTPTKTTAAPPASRTITGTAYAAVWQGDNYGNMQVKIVVTGTHIDNVITIAQSNRPKDVGTRWVTAIVNAQSASVVGNVSGATASSTAYKQSLVSAIAKI